MSWLSDLLAIVLALMKTSDPAAAKSADGGIAVTAAELQAATGSLGAFFTSLNAAIADKNIESGVEVTLEEVVTIAAGLGLGEPFTGTAKTILPLVFGEFNRLAVEPLVAVVGGLGGYVTTTWASDPRHQLNPDGTFKN